MYEEYEDFIRLEVRNGLGWGIFGSYLGILNPDYLPSIITDSKLERFVVEYNGKDYYFPLSSIALFLDRAYEYLPYPNYITVEIPNNSVYMNIGDAPKPVKIIMYYTNGTSKVMNDYDLEVTSSDTDVMTVSGNIDGRVYINAVGEGIASIEVLDPDSGLMTKASVFILPQNKQLFAQSKFVGQFPNGIN